MILSHVDHDQLDALLIPQDEVLVVARETAVSKGLEDSAQDSAPPNVGDVPLVN